MAGRLVQPKHRVLVVSPRRSGQHLVIDYLARGLGETTHVNNISLGPTGISPRTAGQIRPVTAYRDGVAAPPVRQRSPFLRPVHLVTHTITNVEFARPPYDLERMHRGNRWTLVPLVRDPYNWLASLVKVLHRKSYIREQDIPHYLSMYQNILALKNEQGLDVWSYNHFLTDPAYRADKASAFAGFDRDRAKGALGETPTFGGGSSFEGKEAEAEALRKSVMERWQAMTEDDIYRRLMQDTALLDAYAQAFGDLPEARAWADSL